MYIKIILDILRQSSQQLELHFAIGMHLQHAVREFGLRDILSHEELTETLRHVSIAADEIFRLMKPSVYVPVFGPFNYQVRASNSVIDLQVSSMSAVPTHIPELKERTRTYHAVMFSPYIGIKAMEDDIVARIKLATLAQANPLRLQAESTRLRLHIFGVQPSTPDLLYTFLDYKASTDKRAWARYLDSAIKGFESGFHYPLVPCPHACQFKQTCFPSP